MVVHLMLKPINQPIKSISRFRWPTKLFCAPPIIRGGLSWLAGSQSSLNKSLCPPIFWWKGHAAQFYGQLRVNQENDRQDDIRPKIHSHTQLILLSTNLWPLLRILKQENERFAIKSLYTNTWLSHFFTRSNFCGLYLVANRIWP